LPKAHQPEYTVGGALKQEVTEQFKVEFFIFDNLGLLDVIEHQVDDFKAGGGKELNGREFLGQDLGARLRDHELLVVESGHLVEAPQDLLFILDSEHEFLALDVLQFEVQVLVLNKFLLARRLFVRDLRLQALSQ